MSIASRNPVRMAGAVVNSGDCNTGELLWTHGGGRTMGMFSGALLQGSGGTTPVAGGTTGHAVWFSGAGRLNSLFFHQAISGVAMQFYDSAVVARSGVATIQESGRKVLWVTPANNFNVAGTLQWPDKVDIDMPFQSGLALSYPSGCPGVTWTITPETNPAVG